jgi:hypothetical protein
VFVYGDREASECGVSVCDREASECGVSVCGDRETSVMRRRWPTSGSCAMEKEN